MARQLRRPGPERIDLGACPGGIVMHVYGEDGRLILERRLASLTTAEAEGAADLEEVMAALRPNEACCLVAFDGDSGKRWSAGHWAELMAGG